MFYRNKNDWKTDSLRVVSCNIKENCCKVSNLGEGESKCED